MSAQVPLEDTELAALPDDAWSAECEAAAMDANGRWDCLVTSPPGRFLWLRLDFASNGHDTPAIDAVVVEFPRISLRRYLPAVFGADPLGADFTDRFTALFDTQLRSVERHLDRMSTLFDPASTPDGSKPGEADFLAWLASWIGVSTAREWPAERRRRYVKEAAGLYYLRGTPQGLWRQLLLFLGLDGAMERCLAERPQRRCIPALRKCLPGPELAAAAPPPLILEHFKLRRWLIAGHGRLGDDSLLWGRRIVNRAQLSGDTPPPEQSGNARLGESQLNMTQDPLRDPFHYYAHRFSVFVPARLACGGAERRALDQLLAREAPAHTQYEVRCVEPRFRVGVQAMVGLDSVIARTPRGVALGANTLGQGSVLSAPPQRRGGPSLRVGDSRVGAPTALT
jgi:phage tail-like protein